jgi:tRNA 2-thiouridine synthesizing protein C
MNKKRILIICRQPPYGSSLPREGLDIALAASVFDQQLSILFSGEALWQLLKDQQGQQLQQKNYDTVLSAFPLYDIDQLYSCAESMAERKLTSDEFAIPVQTLNKDEIKALIAQHDVVFTF